jgi:hypothetical protein
MDDLTLHRGEEHYPLRPEEKLPLPKEHVGRR